MKKILIYSNMAPSDQIKYAGVFVINQCNLLQQIDTSNTYSLFTLKKTFTSSIGSIKKYARFIYDSYHHIKTNRFDIIHLHYFFPLSIIPWLFKKKYPVKTIITVHGSDLYAKMKKPLPRYIFRHVLKDYDYIICVGEKLGDDFYKTLGIKPDKILCAGVDRNVFFKTNTAKEFDFLFIGTLEYRKGFDVVLKVIEQTINEGYKWCVVGTGNYKPDIEKLAAQNPGNCLYYNKLEQSELNIIFNKARWFFFPSRNEPFGLVASESIFAGTPVISSARGGLNEQVRDRINGLVIQNPDDVEECISLVRYAYNLENTVYEKLVSNCSTSNTQFSLGVVCEELIKIYNSL